MRHLLHAVSSVNSVLTLNVPSPDGGRRKRWVRQVVAIDDCDHLVISDGNLLAWITADDRRLIAKWSVSRGCSVASPEVIVSVVEERA